MLSGRDPEPHGPCVRCAATYAFLTATADLRDLAETEARSQANGIQILNNYFDHYATDPYVISRDDDGPICERTFEATLCRKPDLTITYFGTVDAILEHIGTKQKIVCDHKTTSRLGVDFYNRIKTNFQYFGYVFLAQQRLSPTLDTFLSNGVQVTKTVRGLARQLDTVYDDDLFEFREAVEWQVRNFLQSRKRKFFPMTTPNPCAMWGGCGFREICSAPKEIQETIIQNEFNGSENEG